MKTTLKLNLQQRRESILVDNETKHRVITRVTNASYSYEGTPEVSAGLKALPYRTTRPYAANIANGAHNVFLLKSASSEREKLVDSEWVGTRIVTVADLRQTNPRNPLKGLDGVSCETSWLDMVKAGQVSTYRIEHPTSLGEFQEGLTAPNPLQSYYEDTTLGVLKIYDRVGSSWSQVPGSTWLGSLTVEPPTVNPDDYYYNSDSGILFRGVDTQWEAVNDVTWVGSFADNSSASVSPQDDHYYDISAGELKAHNGVEWTVLSGAWLGELAGAPANPQTDDYYYDYGFSTPVLRRYNGTNWQTVAPCTWRGLYQESVAHTENPYGGAATDNYYLSSVLIRDFSSLVEADSHAADVIARIQKLVADVEATHSGFSTMNNAVLYPEGWKITPV